MANSTASRLNLLRFEPRIKILHFTWIAFFITFFVWFNHAPLLGAIRDSLGLSDDEIKTLLILNVALTIPARVIVGMAVDKLGPKRMFSVLLVISGILCLMFAFAHSFQTLAITRFLMGFAGAGFVIGIRMISEWFPARQVGVAQGIYGGWGNFGSAAAAMSLPAIALAFGGEGTIPARVIVGMAVDKLGPKRMFSVLLVISGILCLMFAFAHSFQTLAITRFLMGFAGAGFVIGIRMISEWFPARQVGVAQGIYGGWGNFGSAAAAMSLPAIALAFGGEDGWRYAAGISGVTALVYAAIYYMSVSDTPKGSTYFAPRKTGAMEISSPGDFILYSIMQAPLFLALGLLAWKLGPMNSGLLSGQLVILCYGGLALLYAWQIYTALRINAHVFSEEVPEIDRYSYTQVAVLNLAYMVSFGSELAVVSMLPLFFVDVFGMSAVEAGILAASFAFTNFIARPAGGWFSDVYGRKKTLLVLIAGIAAGYIAMSQFAPQSWLPYVVAVTMICLGLALLYAWQIYTALRINAHVFSEEVPEIDRYSYTQVAVLNLAYMVSFGSELAVVSMLPLFFVDVFGMSAVEAGILAASFAFTNFIARPAGGWFSDVYGRKKTLLVLIAGIAAGYIAMSQFAPQSWLPYVVAVTMICSLFVNAANGAVYAVVPLIKRRMTGQIAGMVGAYGNVGAVLFLTVLSFVNAQLFFLTIAASAVVTLIAILLFLREPKGQMAETLPDGTVQLIDVE